MTTRGQVEAKLGRAAALAEGKTAGATLVVTEIRRWYGATCIPLALEQRLNRLLTELGQDHVRAAQAHAIGLPTEAKPS